MATQPAPAGEGDRPSPRHDSRDHVDGAVPAAPHASQFQAPSGDEGDSHDQDSDSESRNQKHARNERVVALRRYHKTAYKLINEALDLDARGMVQTALEKYTLGLASLDGGLDITIPPDVSGGEWDKARALREKMGANRGMVLDRVQDLKEKAALLTPRFLSEASQPRAAEKPRPRSAAEAAHAKPAAHMTRPHRQHSHNLPQAKPVPAQAPAKPQAKDKGQWMKNIDSKLADRILNEIVTGGTPVTFDDIIGLQEAKQALQEIVVLPSLRPELFTGIRSPTKGLLLYGPPGTGKTLLAKATASETGAKFFNISASALTSKWVGEGEKLVRALFAMARELQPSVIFIDEVDSLLTARSSNENESTRRLKTELLVQMDGVGSTEGERILLMGATNLPWELDPAAIRRFTRRLYIPLPESDARKAMVSRLLKGVTSKLTSRDFAVIARSTEGFSGSDLKSLTADAALGPVRELAARIVDVPVSSVRPVALQDFQTALTRIHHSVSEESLQQYEQWGAEFGH